MIWITPPDHKYFTNRELCKKCAESLQKVANNHHNTCALTLKKMWSPDKSNFYLPQQRRFMPMGLQAYWLAVDASIKFWDKTLADILIKKQHRGQFIYPKPDKKVPHASSHYNNQKKPNQPYDARLKLNRKHQTLQHKHNPFY